MLETALWLLAVRLLRHRRLSLGLGGLAVLAALVLIAGGAGLIRVSDFRP